MFSIPFFRVTTELGQLEQAPWNKRTKVAYMYEKEDCPLIQPWILQEQNSQKKLRNSNHNIKETGAGNY